MHTKKELELASFQQEAQDMCCKLFEKVYSVFISHLKTQIYPNLARVFTDLPKPLQEDDLAFATEENEEENEEEKKHDENSKSF